MKKILIIETLIILVLSVLFHNIYKLIPNFITSIFFPVNESIWEHGKMIISSFLVYTLIFDRKNISNNFIASIICTFLTYLIFTPIYLYILKTNDNLLITILIYIICIVLSLIIKYTYINTNNKNIALIGYTLIFIIYGILTYYPLKTPLFYDYQTNTYGIK